MSCLHSFIMKNPAGITWQLPKDEIPFSQSNLERIPKEKNRCKIYIKTSALLLVVLLFFFFEGLLLRIKELHHFRMTGSSDESIFIMMCSSTTELKDPAVKTGRHWLHKNLSAWGLFGMRKNFEQGRLGALLRQTLQTYFQDFLKFLLRDLLWDHQSSARNLKSWSALFCFSHLMDYSWVMSTTSRKKKSSFKRAIIMYS